MTEQRSDVIFTHNVHIDSGDIYGHDDNDGWEVPSDDFGSSVMELSPTLIFKIRYPLTNHKIVTIIHEDGSPWSEKNFIDAVCQAYKEVYEEEGEDPGHIPGMLNRARSNGPYGIWGHDISDLILTGASQNPDGSWELHVES